MSNVGTWLQNVVGSVFVYDRTGSALAVGVLNFASFAPILLFSVTGGIVSDRFDRRTVVVVTHLVSFAAASALAAVAWAGQATELHVIGAAFLLQTSWAIAKPSSSAMLPALVDRRELSEAVGLNTLQFMLAQLLGPVLATVMLATSGAAWAFTINALTFLAPIIAMVFLFSRGLAGRALAVAASRAERSFGGAIAFIRSEPWIAWVLVGVVATSSVLEIIRTLSPALVTTRLGAPSSQTGLIVAAQSIGMVLGILISVPIGRRGLAKPTAPAGFVFQLVGLAIVSVARDLPVAAAAVALIGCGFSLTFPVLTGTIQTEVPDAVLGRVLAVHQMSHLGNRPIAALAAGALATAFGFATAALAGMLLAPLGLIAVRAAWRALDRRADALAAAASTAP